MPRVSVLLTCFNHLEFLPEALSSIEGQSFRDFEVIAVDDGSTDGTREWLSDRAARIRVILNAENIGTYGSLNIAIAAAQGEYLAILNDDDAWMPEKLEMQVAMLDANGPMGLCHVSGTFIDENGSEISGAPLGFEYPRTSSGWILPDLIHHNKIIPSSAMIRASVLKGVGVFEPSYYGCGDWQLFLRIARSHDIGFIDEPLLRYRVHASNASRNIAKMDEDDERIRSWIDAETPHLLAGHSNNRALVEALAHNLACLGTIRTCNGDRQGGRRAYARSIKMMPLRLKSYLRWATTFLPQNAIRNMR